jgi:competence protein ComEC
MDRINQNYPGFRSSSPVAAAVGFSTGVGLFHLLPDMPPVWLLSTVAAILLPAVLRLAPLRPLFFAALGALWAQFGACNVLCEPFPEDLLGQDVLVQGRIASLPQDRSGATRFLFRVDQARHEGRALPFRGLVRLSWYREAPEVRAGELWALRVRLKPPHGFANPGGFDYERWLFQQGIRATGYVRDGGDLRPLQDGPGPYWVDRWRQGLRDHLHSTLDGSPAGPVVLALVIGDRSGMTPDQWDTFTRTGTNHLVAISGLHVGLVATSLFFLGRWVWSRSTRLVLLLPAPRAGAIAALIGAFGYSALAGFAVSTQRALIMLVVVLAALFWSRTLRPATSIAFALAGVLLVDPAAVLSHGFWLSFGAVAALLYALGNRLTDRSIWSRWGKAQWVVALGLLPLLLLSFGRTSLVAPMVNLVAVPLFSLVLLPLVLVSALADLTTGIGAPLGWMAALLSRVMDLLEAAAAWEWSAVSISGRPGWVWFAGFAGSLLLLSPRGLPGRWLGMPMFLPLILIRPPAPVQGEVWLRLLDVGQGLSAVLRTASHTLVYDTGPAYPSGFNTGSVVVLPYLREVGVDRINTLVLSHGDRDHSGGFAGLVSGIGIDDILAGEPREVQDHRVRGCRAGQGWSWDGVDFEMLHPVGAGLSGNDSSCVLRVAADGMSLLLTGDIEHGVESELVETLGPDLRTTLLVAGHHGSATSSSQPFLEAVAPSWVLYSSGFANRYGFPSEEVRLRVAGLGASELVVAETGSVWFGLTSAGLEGPDLYRERHRRLWTHRVRDSVAF